MDEKEARRDRLSASKKVYGSLPQRSCNGFVEIDPQEAI